MQSTPTSLLASQSLTADFKTLNITVAIGEIAESVPRSSVYSNTNITDEHVAAWSTPSRSIPARTERNMDTPIGMTTNIHTGSPSLIDKQPAFDSSLRSPSIKPLNITGYLAAFDGSTAVKISEITTAMQCRESSAL